jgi:rubrerythrin
LDHLIRREREDQALYKAYLQKVEKPGMQQLLHSLLDQEHEHERMLENITNSHSYDEVFRDAERVPVDLVRYTLSKELSDDMNYNDILTHIIEREERGAALYAELSKLAGNDEVTVLFSNMGFEEQKHKNWAVDRYELEMLASF